MLLLWVPLSLGSICALLALAVRLEEDRARATIRMSVRSSRLSPEIAEALAAAELAPVLAAHGMGRR